MRTPRARHAYPVAVGAAGAERALTLIRREL
ncbi:MAG: hypothetical protein JWM31_1556 [Solirubrobacterales bacterium]|nr:hypothetical protein [Solirubrobacterales bacterium]